MKIIVIIIHVVSLLYVNTILINKGTWIADTTNQFSGISIEELRIYTGTIIKSSNNSSNSKRIQTSPFTSNFDARTQWPECIHPIRNQGACGSCWAFAISEGFSDRICITTSNSTNIVLSPEDLVSCDTTNQGCGGGDLYKAWKYIEEQGIVSDSCFPYTSATGNVTTCKFICSDYELWTTYRAKNIRMLPTNIAMDEILKNGPIITAFDVYEDFFSYKSGIYVSSYQDWVGSHAVKVIGFGHDEDSGLDYWIASNSWGNAWGMEGYFKIATGQCGFDNNFITGEYDGKNSHQTILNLKSLNRHKNIVYTE